jgi:hypothetical protein
MIRRLPDARHLVLLLGLTPAAAGAQGAGAGDPCAPSSLELSSPRGTVLQSSRLILRWRSTDGGPFVVTITDEAGEPVYTSTTFGHELRVMVNRGAGEMRGPHAPQLENGRSYRWNVVPQFAADPKACPRAEFRLLDERSSEADAAKFEAAARRLGVTDEARELEGRLELARLYLRDGFYAEAEQEMRRLQQRGYDDPRVPRLLTEIYRTTHRPLSLEDLQHPSEEPAGPF